MRKAAIFLAVTLSACGTSGGAGPNGDGGVGADGGGDVVDAVGARPDGAGTTAGCGIVPSVTGTVVETVDLSGTERSYTLVVPAGYAAQTPHALVFAWHGRGSNGAQARSYFGVESESAGAALFVYPQGLGQSSPQDTGWDLSLSGSVDVALFDYLLGELSTRYCIDRDRVFSMGHSFGGYMSNHLACQRSDVLRAIASVAGGGPYGSCGSAVAAWITHGNSDTVVAISEGVASRDHWVAVNGCQGETVAGTPSLCANYLGCEGDPVVWCPHDETAFGGHGWPSFTAESIWRFFAQF